MDSFAPPDPLGHLPRDAYAHLIVTLRAILPPLVDASPQAQAHRDHAAIVQVAALCPANAAEAVLAGQYVAANAQAMDCLRLARDPDITPDWALRCTAQAASMMRQAQGAMRLLLRAQAVRVKQEADRSAVDRAAWTEHCATQWMIGALPSVCEAPDPLAPDLRPMPDPCPDWHPDSWAAAVPVADDPYQKQGHRPKERSHETIPTPSQADPAIPFHAAAATGPPNG